MKREELVQAVGQAFNLAGSHCIGYDCYFDATDLRGALKAFAAYAGFLRTSPPSARAVTL